MTNAAAQTEGPAPHICGECGSRIAGRWERLTPGLCRTLIKFYAAICEKGKNELHLQKEADFTKTEWTNFVKLRYFALAVKVDDKPGYWLLTWQGRDFLRNLYSVPSRVLIFQNHIRERNTERVRIADVLKTEPYWMVRDDFLDPARTQPTEIRQQVLF